MKEKAIVLITAFFGILLMVTAVSTMDYYLLELATDYPPYLNGLLYGGVLLVLPAFIYAILKGE